MQTLSLHELKKELKKLEAAEVAEICLRLAKYRKENKELLHYLLFESHDEEHYIDKVKEEVVSMFLDLEPKITYRNLKQIRKILRLVNKHIKYSGSRKTEIELLIFFCRALKASGLTIYKSTALTSLYNRQLQRATTTLSKLHEDLQLDYRDELLELGEIRN